MTSTSWPPLLVGGLAGEARVAVEAIAADLAAHQSLISPFGPDPEFSLGHGAAGVALFFTYLDQALPGRGYGGLGCDLLGDAVGTAAGSPSTDFWVGGPGVAWTLSHLLARPDIESAWDAEALARARSLMEGEGAGLFDGAAGIAHLCNRLAQATGDEWAARDARAAFRLLLAMRRPGEGIGGFRARLRDGRGRTLWADDPGFSRGASGIGLALLAAISEVEPAWDRLLLTRVTDFSCRRRGAGQAVPGNTPFRRISTLRGSSSTLFSAEDV
jgi:hypothetical protein